MQLHGESQIFLPFWPNLFCDANKQVVDSIDSHVSMLLVAEPMLYTCTETSIDCGGV